MSEAVKKSDVAVEAVSAGAQSGLVSPFSTGSSFETAWRMATCLSSSTMVPAAFRGPEGRSNAMIALELANRMGISVFQVMQNLYIIKGRPAFSAQFVIAALRASRRFSMLKYNKRFADDGKILGCRAYATELLTGEVIEGPEVTMEMAKAEGWTNNSKWRTMPEAMMMYRAAVFFARMNAPDVLMGYAVEGDTFSSQGVRDLGTAEVKAGADAPVDTMSKTDKFNALADAADAEEEAVTAKDVEVKE